MFVLFHLLLPFIVVVASFERRINSRQNSRFNQKNETLSICVSDPDILDPNDNLSNIQNLVLFEREMFEDYSYMSISRL